MPFRAHHGPTDWIEMQQPAYAPKLKVKDGEKWSEALAGYLHPGEVIWALAKTNSMRPGMDALAVTNARLIGYAARELKFKQTQAFKVQVDADAIETFEFTRKSGFSKLGVTTRTDEWRVFGNILDADVDFVGYYVQTLAQAGFPAEVRGALEQAENAAHASAAASQEAAQHQLSGRSAVPTVGPPLKEAAWKSLHEHSAPGELPWFVLNSAGGRGLLAAFEDRLIIAKVGAMTSMMAGSMGGGRVTTFPYTDITNIEFNGGLMMGVLEILTPSYQGTANRDYWTVGTKQSGSPFSLSNCLPLDKSQYKAALPKLNELQKKISEAKRPNVVVQQNSAPTPAASGLAEELRGLGELYQQGILDQAEFAAAKSAAIARHSAS